MSEHTEQAALFEWAAWSQGKEPRLALLHAIPNGGLRKLGVAGKLKAEGVKRGVPDIFFPVPWNDAHGLYIEMKAGTNKPTKEQQQWIADLRAMGYRVRVCYGWQEAATYIVRYLCEEPAEFGL